MTITPAQNAERYGQADLNKLQVGRPAPANTTGRSEIAHLMAGALLLDIHADERELLHGKTSDELHERLTTAEFVAKSGLGLTMPTFNLVRNPATPNGSTVTGTPVRDGASMTV